MFKKKAWVWNIHNPLQLRALCDPAALLSWRQSWSGQCVKDKTPGHQQISNPCRHPLTSWITDRYSSFADCQVPEFEDWQLTLIVCIFLDP